MKMLLIIFLIPLLSFGCKVSKNLNNELGDEKINRLKRLSSFLIANDDKTYNFDYNKINLPIGYDTMSKFREFDLTIDDKDLDSIYNKYFLYGKMLDSLLIYQGEHKVSYSELIKYLGKPTSFGTMRYEFVTNLHYRFNTTYSPKCSDLDTFKYLHYQNCALLDFKINNNGYLNNVNKTFFNP